MENYIICDTTTFNFPLDSMDSTDSIFELNWTE